MTRDQADARAKQDDITRLSDRRKDVKIVLKSGEPAVYVLRNVLRASEPPKRAHRGGTRHEKPEDHRREGPGVPVAEDPMHHMAVGLLNEWGLKAKTPPSATVRDHRYRNEHESEWQEARDQDLAFSTKYLGQIREQGKRGEEWVIKTSADTIHSSRDILYIRAFLDQIRALWTIVGVIFDTLEPRAMELFEETFERTRRSNILADWIAHTWFFFMAIVIVSNRRVAPHYDASDPLHGWAASTPFGTYRGGDLFFPDIKLRIALNPGDVLVFRSALLRHSVLPFQLFTYRPATAAACLALPQLRQG